MSKTMNALGGALTNDKESYCYINRENCAPNRVDRYGVFRYVGRPNHKDFRVFELCRLWYPHPEAPDQTIYLVDWVEVAAPTQTRQMIVNLCESMRGLQLVCTQPFVGQNVTNNLKSV